MFRKICLFICATILPVRVFAASKASKDLKPQVSAPVAYVRERSFDELCKFGSEARAYTFMLGDKRIVIGVDYIRNLSGISEELPADLSDYVISAIGKISPQFATYRKYAGPIGVPGTGPYLAPPTADPKVDFWISGSLERASEIYKQQTNDTGDATGGGGKGQFDAHLGRNRTRTIKSLTVTFALAGPDKVSVPGANATYRIDVEQLQRERSFAVYVAGNGVSRDSTVTITQNLDDAIYDATADSIIHCLGNALLLPYYRCSSIFQPDRELDSRVRDSLKRLTRQDLEQNLKLWMLVDGYPVALNDLLHLTDHDRAVVEVEMYHRKMAYSDGSLVELAFSLWQNLDYVNGSQKVEQLLAAIAQKQKQDQLAQAQQAAAAAEAAAKQKHEEQLKQAAEAAAKQKEEQQKQAAETKSVHRRRSARNTHATSQEREAQNRS